MNYDSGILTKVYILRRSSEEGSWLKADLHSPGSADNEDDSGVSQDSNKGDGAVEYWEKHNHAGLEKRLLIHTFNIQVFFEPAID